MRETHTTPRDFDAFFERAAGVPPFPYQRRLAEGDLWPARVEVPTGLGKTLAIIVSWLWRRRPGGPFHTATPRRLVYCLPMRVLVEQTRDVVRSVIERLGADVRVVVLMGGVDDDGAWDTRPEDDAIIIGTQDMLLSRALNRGYGMSRYRWPLHFGMLNNDCLWVIDEVQLVGSGVATTAQLQAFRRRLGTIRPSQTSWMSATLEDGWIRTVDVEDADVVGRLALDEADRADPVVAQRIGARKLCASASASMGDQRALASEIERTHRAGTRTLAVVNTVERARDLFVQLRKTKTNATLVLLHSRFRQAERDAALARALAAPTDAGTIVVSTQVIEAGVDLTSSTLFTEVAPWASLVQRFGRCNRRGEDADARVLWVPLPNDDKARAKVALPYDVGVLAEAQGTLSLLAEVGPSALPRKPMALERGLVLRRRDLLDLFDTTPDLMGNDVDVSRFIRDVDDQDVRVCWRAVEDAPARTDATPAREELCAVPVGVAREWHKSKRAMWCWNGLDGRWTETERIYPGLTLVLRAADGGYDDVLGLDPKGTAAVTPVTSTHADPRDEDREYDGDPESEWRHWYTLSAHSIDVAGEAATLADAIDLPAALRDALIEAGRWHDAGKAHAVWQAAAKRLGTHPPAELVAKSQAERGRITYEGRRGFRHELASALLALAHGKEDLVCFLVACHHGKVRMSLRALPFENTPRGPDGSEDAEIRHARGVWEGDALPAVDLGDGIVVPPTKLTLRYMLLGDDDQTGPSWLTRVLALRDSADLGPFRLGFLEGLVKSADERASARRRGS